MIAKIPVALRDGNSSFKDLVNYCLGRTGHAKGAVLYVGKWKIDLPETAVIEMEGLALENVRSKNPAMRFILSWREMESPMRELRERQKSECENLCASQHKARDELRQESWVGRGRELNQLRSIFAYFQKRARLDQRDEHRVEREELKSKYPSPISVV